MEILEYLQKFELDQITFPRSTETFTFFALTILLFTIFEYLSQTSLLKLLNFLILIALRDLR